MIGSRFCNKYRAKSGDVRECAADWPEMTLQLFRYIIDSESVNVDDCDFVIDDGF